MSMPDNTIVQSGVNSDRKRQLDGQGAAVGRARRPLTGILQIVVVAAFVAVAVFYSQERSGGDPRVTSGAAPGAVPAATQVAISVIQPVVTTQVLKVRATGTVVARTYVALTPQVGGRVVSIAPALRSGGRFSAGDELLRIERSDYLLALEQANADVAGAESALKLQRAESDAARANYALLHPGKEVPPLVAKIPQIDQALARVAAARARAEIAKLDLSRTVFSLPFDGRITETNAEVGQVLTRGQSFGQAFALDAIEAVVPIAPDDLALLAPGQGRAARIIAGDFEVAGVVERVSAELDARSRFARLFISLIDGSLLKPGTFVDVEIDGPAIAEVMLLPPDAEQPGGHVWMVHEDGSLRAHWPVTRGRSDEGWIVDAFEFGEGVAVGTVPGGREGLPVRAIDNAS